jgi:hypothetical protein
MQNKLGLDIVSKENLMMVFLQPKPKVIGTLARQVTDLTVSIGCECPMVFSLAGEK